MKLHLTPTPLAATDDGKTGPKESYALVPLSVAGNLARAMPDCQSAVLMALAWQALLHQRMHKGEFAGRAVASLSAGQLSKQTGRPIRTVKHALSRLSASGRVIKLSRGAGRKGCYALPSLGDPIPKVKPP